MFSCSHPLFFISHFLPPFYPFSHLIFRNLGKTFPRYGRIYIDYQRFTRKVFPIFPFSHFPTPSFSKCKRATVETHKHKVQNDSTNEHQRCAPRRNSTHSVGHEKQRLIAHQRCRLTSTKGRNIWQIGSHLRSSFSLSFLYILLHSLTLLAQGASTNDATRGSTNKTVLWLNGA